MDKLEQYLRQVCRGIGGPRALRHHLRRELREHLQDAVAQHRAAGMAEPDAIALALADFGKPEDVRSELEDTHGHRLMALVIDKALQWKENTMRAKWLWSTWAYLAVFIILALNLFFIAFGALYIVPKFKMFVREGWIGLDRTEPLLAWIPGFIRLLDKLGEATTWLLLGAGVLWGLFEWRVRSENKPMMRVAALGTASLGLVVLLGMLVFAMIVPLMVGLPSSMVRRPEPIVQTLSEHVETSVAALQEAREQNDWDKMEENVSQAAGALHNLNLLGSSGPALAALQDQHTVEALRSNLKEADQALRMAQHAVLLRDPARLDLALKKFAEQYGPIHKAARVDN
jgi:hypothetical protein